MKKKTEKKVEVKKVVVEKKVETKKEEVKKEKKTKEEKRIEARPNGGKVEHKIDGRKLGKAGLVIESVTKREVNGRSYNHITITNGTTFLLSDRDLEAQVSN